MTRSRGFHRALPRSALHHESLDTSARPPVPEAKKGACEGFLTRSWARYCFGAVTLAALCSLAVLLSGCGSSTKTMQKKLEEIAMEDLQDIIKEVPSKAKSAMLRKPYFKIDDFQEFHGDTARVYQAKATLVFFYLDPSLDLCQVRKYRYKTSSGLWDRYDVKLIHFPKKYSDL
ncbi:MAG: hypothetical protein ABI036_05590 [Fibrobacteria bacterium]